MSAPVSVTLIMLGFMLFFAIAGVLFAELKQEEEERRHWWREDE